MGGQGTVVITGASTGIGRACALELDRLGFQVFAGVRKEEDGQDLQRQASSQLTPLLIDVTDPEGINKAAQTVAALVGTTGVAGLINNAGIAVGGPLEYLPIAELRRQLEINVIGQVATTQAFLALLRPGRGRVINMSSISGRVAMPFFGPYAASKFALEALTDALRLELSPWGIEVVSIQPGAIATPIWHKSLQKGDQIVEGFPAQAQSLYGERLNRLRQTVVKTAQRGSSPEAVARVVAQALTAKRPKTRYVVGHDAQLAALFLKFLPDRWRDWLVMRNSR
jgi:NAD(P)-dependent dehydrogenase (short-subunit alcohol dehydrogenase family)